MFSYPEIPPTRDFKNISYALYRVRQISRDTRENPPYSLSDEEWVEVLEDTKLGDTYQVFKAVHSAVSTNPERLQSLSEESGSYTFADLEATKRGWINSQRELNGKLGLGSGGSLVSVPVVIGCKFP